MLFRDVHINSYYALHSHDSWPSSVSACQCYCCHCSVILKLLSMMYGVDRELHVVVDISLWHEFISLTFIIFETVVELSVACVCA